MKKLIALALLLLWRGGVAWAQEEPVAIDGIVARVNKDIITLSAYRRAQQDLRMQLQQELTGQPLEDEYQRGLKELLQNLIDTQLLVQKADELAINVEAQINEYLIKLAEQNSFPPSKIDEMLQKMGFDPDQARQMIRMRFLREAVIGREVYPRVFQNIFDKDSEAFYREHLDVFTEPAAVKLSEIYIKISAKRPRDQAAGLMRQIQQQIKAGATFADLAKQYSDGPSAAQGGDLGWFNLDPRPELGEVQRTAIEGKQAGQITEPLELSDGFRLFHVDERREKKEKPLTPELRREINMRLAQQRAQPAIQEFLQRLRKDAYIYIADAYKPKEDAAADQPSHGQSKKQK
jgi:peptidyl-prolyl cis-trans isomerase SurA